MTEQSPKPVSLRPPRTSSRPNGKRRDNAPSTSAGMPASMVRPARDASVFGRASWKDSLHSAAPPSGPGVMVGMPPFPADAPPFAAGAPLPPPFPVGAPPLQDMEPPAAGAPALLLMPPGSAGSPPPSSPQLEA